jgi:hypothetical protein
MFTAFSQRAMLTAVIAFSTTLVAAQPPAQGPPAQQPGTPAVAPTDADVQSRALLLVEQLGDEKFVRRELATELLKEMGLAAIPALDKGVGNFDREIRYRSIRILSAIKERDFQRRLDAFVAGKETSDDALPGWVEFSEMHGDEQKTRSLFVKIQKSESELMKSLGLRPAELQSALNQRATTIQTQRGQGSQVEIGTVAAFLFVMCLEDVKPTTYTSSTTFNLCYQNAFRAEMEAGANKDMLRRMLGLWIKRNGDSATASQALGLAMQYSLKEGLEPAKKIVSDKTAPRHTRQYAVLVIGKLGDKTYLPLLESLLDDDSEIMKNTIKNINYRTELRDVALAVAVRMTGQDLKDYGFDRAQVSRDVVITSTLGFASDEDRAKSMAKWTAYRKTTPLEKEVEKDVEKDVKG